MIIRYFPIETRILNTFRYVDLAPQNKSTFSYEYCSLIRDIGSTFTSILDTLVRNTFKKIKKEYNIIDYRRFLLQEVSNIELLGVQLFCPFKQNMVLPFENISNLKHRLNWWNAYNNLKHSEKENFVNGCLSNVIHSMSALAILYALMSKEGMAIGRLFSYIGYFKPLRMVKQCLFPI